MKTSYHLLFQNLDDATSDADQYATELRLAEQAEPLGFDGIWCVEHHFDKDYSMCPDNLQLLSYLAGRTTSIELVPAAVILPWHEQPLRVAEKIAMLDNMSDGRVYLGVGRGLAKDEYASFGIDMEESRERFDESYAIISNALETGKAKAEGKFFNHPESPVRPAPARSFKDRIFTIAMSPDSLDIAAKSGTAMATFVVGPAEAHKPLIDGYREAFQKYNGRPAPSPHLDEFVYCHEDPEEAERAAREYITNYYVQFIRHYSMLGDHFASTKGYQSYAALASAISEAGALGAAEAYLQAQTWGTPDQVIEKIKAKRAVLGDYDLTGIFMYGGMSYETAEASMRLWAEKVIPAVKDL
ncbi:LLM class flavin-dependent oxidoreductase [Streptomyces sp. S1D4-11]|nr:LLM class flavin-dependent oxidoreductase [Streptomyces sp. S1D4-11]QIZ01157.1 LLM class flavin-dependent oxidoreductase [Streptomyces sp. S1D4-11]